MSSNPKQILAHSFLHSPKGHLNSHFIEGDPKAKLPRGEGHGYVQKCLPSSVLGLRGSQQEGMCSSGQVHCSRIL